MSGFRSEDWMRQIRRDLCAGVKAVGDKYGVSFELGVPTVDTLRVTCKLEGVVVKPGETLPQSHWNASCRQFGLEEGDWHKTFADGNGVEYQLQTIRPGDRTCKIVVNRLKPNPENNLGVNPDFVDKLYRLPLGRTPLATPIKKTRQKKQKLLK